MGIGRKIVLGGVAVLALGAAVVGVRSWTYAAAAIDTAENVKLADATPFDSAAAARRLGEAIRFRTVSNQDAAANEWAEWDKFHAWLQTSYPRFHAVARRETVAGRTLVYTWQGSDASAKPIILMGHQDVVPITPGTEKDWKHAPFGGEVAGGAVWGRGAMDDKGNLIALFEAMEALAARGYVPKRTIYLVSGHDEEVGGAGARAAAALLGSRGVRALFTLDEGSIIVTDAPLVNGPVVLIGVAEKGYATLRLTAKAEGGHSSMPPPEIATVNLARAVTAINDRPFAYEFRGPAADMVRALAAKKGGSARVAVANEWLLGGTLIREVTATPAGAAALHTTIAPTMLSGSPKENVLPQAATALVNYRIAPWQTSRDVMARAREAVGKLPVTLAWDTPPRDPTPVSSTRSEGWRLITAVARAEAPKGAPVAPYLVLGGTDSRNFSGISDDVYRFAPIQLASTETKMFHGTNEHMTVANLDRMIRYFTRLVATAG